MHRHTMPLAALCGGFNLVLAYVGRAQDSHCDILIGTGIFSKKIGLLKCAFHGVFMVLRYFYLTDWTGVLLILRYYYLVDLLSVLNFVGIVWRETCSSICRFADSRFVMGVCMDSSNQFLVWPVLTFPTFLTFRNSRYSWSYRHSQSTTMQNAKKISRLSKVSLLRP